MKRTDFRPRPYNDKPTYYGKIGDTRHVIKRFIAGNVAKTSNNTLHTDGTRLYSYNTVIANRQEDGRILVNKTRYSNTTSKQQSRLIGELMSAKQKYEVTGNKPYGYEGEDFSTEHAKAIPKTFKEGTLHEKKDYLAKSIHGKEYNELNHYQRDAINNFLYKEHGMDMSEADSEVGKFINAERYAEKIAEEKKSSAEYEKESKELHKIAQDEKKHAHTLKMISHEKYLKGDTSINTPEEVEKFKGD